MSLRSRFRKVPARRGITVVVVLGLISVTLALSYAILRTQGTSVQIQGNSQRRSSARSAALTGMSIAIQRMHGASWGGVDTTFTATLGPYQRYEVTYTAGDASLTVGHPDYADYPFRVTVNVTGYVTDPANPSAASSHRVQSVVRLAPKDVTPAPPEWPQIVQNVLYQLRDNDFRLDVPTRIEGPVRLQGKLRLGENYAWSAGAKSKFLLDLNLMRLAPGPDYRPFNGPVSLPFSDTDATTRNLLTVNLGLTLSDIVKTTPSAELAHPGALSTYRIYPGGPLYNVRALGSTLENVTYDPDPLTNPLGISVRTGDVTVRGNVTIRGILVTSGSATFQGSNLLVEPVALPGLNGSTTKINLPTVLAAADVRFQSGAAGEIKGVLGIWNELAIDKRPQAPLLAINGRVLARTVTVLERNEWDLSGLVWALLYTLFNNQLTEPLGLQWLPAYLGLSGMNPQPKVTLIPEAVPVTYLWLKANTPVYQPLPADGGLRWDVLKWRDSL